MKFKYAIRVLELARKDLRLSLTYITTLEHQKEIDEQIKELTQAIDILTTFSSNDANYWKAISKHPTK